MLYKNYIRVLYINLTDQKIRVENREDLKDYLGGVGVATKLLQENMKPQLDPLHEEQPVIFSIGAISSIFPVVTKTAAMFISPLTGELGESYAGGRMALTMMMAGFDAFVITGRHPHQIYLSINSHDVSFRDARAFKGMAATDVGRFIREREPGAGKRSILRIGPAGENLVRFASVCVDTYRHFGRLGLGAVMGSKNLKAMSITGDKSIPIENHGKYLKTYRKIYDQCTDTELMKKYHDLGTPVNVEPLSEAGGMPTLNLTSGTYEKADKISGEKFAENNLVRKMACTGCPVGCIHIGQYRKEFDIGHEYESVQVGYDYELIFALGSFIGVDDTDRILELIDKVEEMGMDAMSTGVVLGWVTEAYQNGVITEKETLIPVAFGEAESYLKIIEWIGTCKTPFYSDLAQGAAKAAKKYGGEDYAITIAGNETSGYHTGYGSLTGALVGARHSHLCNGGYAIDQSNKPLTEEQMAEKLLEEEIERCALNSLVICLFARKVYTEETILEALQSAGYDNITQEELEKTALRIFKTKREIKKALGFDEKDVKIPKRFFETPSMNGKLDPEAVSRIVALFQEKAEMKIT